MVHEFWVALLHEMINLFYRLVSIFRYSPKEVMEGQKFGTVFSGIFSSFQRNLPWMQCYKEDFRDYARSLLTT